MTYVKILNREGSPMRMPAYLAALFLSLFLTACGGGGDPVVSDSAAETEGEETPDEVTTSSTVANPQIGTGTGNDFLSGSLLITQSTLSAGGSTQITATIVDADEGNKKIVSQEYFVEFSSSCSTDAKAEFSKENVQTSSGEISVTYTATGCSGSDLITFTLRNLDGQSSIDVATGTITVAPPEIGAITYIGADAAAISIATIGDAVLPKLTTLTFKVLDRGNNPVSNRTVEFELSNNSGGMALSLISSVTNESGEVKTAILSGSTHGITTVRATTYATDNTTKIYTTSQQISVTTGIADQDSFSLVVDKLSTRGWDSFGTGSEVEVTAFANDHFQNPVPDGTIINFMADSGSIGSSCETVAGTCSVTWLSANPRPGSDWAGNLFVADNTRIYDAQLVTYDASWNGGLPGVASVTAYTIGEAGFSDSNGNDLYDAGEEFTPYAEAFLDANDNGIYDYNSSTNPREEVIDFNSDGSHSAAPSTYQGITCSDNSTHCQSLLHVRDTVKFLVASAQTVVSLYSVSGTSSGDLTGSSCVVMDGEDIELTYLISDVNGLMPPTGTSISLDVGDLEIVGTSNREVGSGDYSTNGWYEEFVIRPDSQEPTFIPESPILNVGQVDEREVPHPNALQLTSFTGITVGTVPALPKSDQALQLTFKDACGQSVSEGLSVIAELSNGQFSTGDPTFQSFDVAPGAGSLSLSIVTDGASSYDASGITLTIFRDGSTSSNEIQLSLLD